MIPHLPLCSTCQAHDFWVQKWKSSSKTRFGLPKRVSGPKSRPKPSVITVSNALWQKVENFWTFRIFLFLQKVTFWKSEFPSVYGPHLRVQKRQSATWALLSTLALPKWPSATFSYVYDVFEGSESPKCTFGTFGLGPIFLSAKGVPGGPDPYQAVSYTHLTLPTILLV